MTTRASRQELVAAGTVLLLHLLAALFFLRTQSQEHISQSTEDTLVVHWIHRIPAESTRTAKVNGARVLATPNKHRNADEIANSQPPVSNQSNHPGPQQLLLTAPQVKISFNRGPLHQQERFDATPDRMNLTMIDASLGGMLQRMTKAQICKELRSALAKTSGDATTIMATMKEQGCFRS